MLFCSSAHVRLFSPAVGPLFSASGFLSPASSSLFVFTQTADLRFRAALAPRRRCLRVRQSRPTSAVHTVFRSVMPWFVKGLRCLDELFARPRADPRVRSSPQRAARVEGVVSRARLFHSRHGRELRRAACVATLVRRREHLVAEPVPRRSAHCAFCRALLCSVSRDRALWYSLTCGLLN